MADPTKYVPGYDFSDYQATNPADPLPGTQVDIELANIAQANGQAVDAIKDVRRSDGKLKNGIVTPDSLSAGTQALFTNGEIDVDSAFVPSMTGADAVTVRSVLERIITPEFFGAAGDGVFNPATGEYDGTDDTAAIMAALDALQTNGLGGTVYFDPAKVYVCSSSTSRVGGSLTRTLELYGDNITLAGGGLIAFKGSHGANWRCLMVGGAGKIANGTGDITAQRCVDKAGVAITGPIAQGAQEVPVAPGDEIAFAAGDVVFIRSGQVLTAGLTEPNSELAVVADVASGVVALTKPTSKPYEQEYFISGTSGRTSASVTANPARYEIVNVTDRVSRGVRFDGIRLFNKTGGLQLLSTWGVLGGEFDVELVEYPYLGWGHRDCSEFRHDARLHHNGENNIGYGWHPSTGCTRYRGRIDQTSEGFNSVNLHEACADMALDVRSRNVGGVGEVLAGFSLNDRGYNLAVHLDLDIGASTINAFQALASTGATLSNVSIWLDYVRGNARDDTGQVLFERMNVVNGVVSLRGAQLSGRARGHQTPGCMTGIVTFNKGLDLGRLPQYAIPYALIVDTVTAFNGTSNRINVGYSGLAHAFGNSVIVGTAGAQQLKPGDAEAGPSLSRRQTAERAVLVDWAGTGTPSAGKAVVTILYFIAARDD